MKNHFYYFTPVIIIVSIAMFVSRNTGKHHAMAGIITKNFDVKNFNSLDIGSAFTIRINKSNEYKVTVKADAALMDKVKVSVNGGWLHVSSENSGTGSSQVKNSILVEIGMPSLNKITFSGATESDVNGFNEKIMEIKLSGASSCRMDVLCDSVSLSLGGASKITLSGKGTTLEGKASGASTIHAGGYVVTRAYVDAGGASTVHLNAAASLVGKASSASTVTYKGNPVEINVETSGASSVRRAE